MSHTAEQPAPARVVVHPAALAGTLRTADGHELAVQGFPHPRAVDGESGMVLVLLTPGMDDPDELADDDLDSATLEYPTARGVIRVQGEAHRMADPLLVRFEADGDPEVIQRRAFVRVPTPQPVTVGSDRNPMRTYTVDLSGGGMLLSGAPGLREGHTVTFEVRIDRDETPIRGAARVVRAHPDGRRALEFEHIAEVERQRLIRFIFACLRAGRAKTRGDLI